MGSTARSPSNKAELEVIGIIESQWETAGTREVSANVPIIQTLLAEIKVLEGNNNPQFSILSSDHVESASHLQVLTLIHQEQQSNDL